MRKKYLSALLFGALLVASTGTFTSCKDYDDEINNLQEQITTNKDAIAALQKLVGEGKWVTSISPIENGFTVTMSDGTTTEIKGINGDDGAAGQDGKPGTMWRINETTFNWESSADGGLTWVDTKICAKGEKGDQGEAGQPGAPGEPGQPGEPGKDCPSPEISEDGYWIVYKWDAEKNDYVSEKTTIKAEAVNVWAEDKGDYIILHVGDQSYKLPTSEEAATTVEVSLAEDKIFDGIVWGVAGAKVDDWRGNTIEKDAFLVSKVGEIDVEVTPYSYELNNQKLTLVDTEGNEAPVDVKAIPVAEAEDGKPAVKPTRSVSVNGEWKLTFEFKDEVNAENIEEKFGTEESDYLFALAVNGKPVTPYGITVDIPGKKTGSILNDNGKIENTYIKNPSMDNPYAFNNNNQVYFYNVSITESTEYTLTTYNTTGIVDSYMVFEGANKTKAELYNVSIVDDMTVKPSAEAAGQNMTATLYMLDVTGKVAKASVNLTFAGTTVETPAEAPASTFNVTDVQNATDGLDAQTVYIDVTGMFNATEALKLGDYKITVQGLDKIFTAKTTAGAAASIGLTRTLYQSDKETVFNPTVDDVSKLKWLAITVDARESEDLLFYNSTVEAKAYELTTTVLSNGNELRKFKSKLNVVVPAFDDLFATVSGGLWNGNTYTATITGSGTPQVAFDNAFTAKTNDYPKRELTLTSLKAGNNNAYTGSLAIGGTTLTTGDNKVISNNAINIKTLSAKVEYKFGGKLTASKSFNVNLRSIFEGIDLKYYVNGVAQVSDYTVSLTADNKISALSFNNSKPVTGLGVEFNNDLKALDSDLNNASGSLAGISTKNVISVEVEGNDALTATLVNSGIQIAKSSGSINPGDGGTLVIKFTDSVGIIITEKVNFVK